MAIIMPNCGEDDALFLGMPDPPHLRSRIVQSDIEVRLVCNSVYCPNRVDLKLKAIPSRLSRLTEHCQLLLPTVVTTTIAAGVRQSSTFAGLGPNLPVSPSLSLSTVFVAPQSRPSFPPYFVFITLIPPI